MIENVTDESVILTEAEMLEVTQTSTLEELHQLLDKLREMAVVVFWDRRPDGSYYLAWWPKGFRWLTEKEIRASQQPGPERYPGEWRDLYEWHR